MADPVGPAAPEPPDQPARVRIGTDLSSTLVVDAGAGSGKTAALVGRVLALVTTGEAELSRIAAITFTEKAAAELGDRVRRRLEECIEAQPGTVEEQRCRLALEQLDGAAIGTLHSFARRILSEHPIEAGLPPRIEVLDEVSSDVAFDQRWAMFQDELLSETAMERTLLLFFAAGTRPDALRTLARAFEDNWDLVEEQVPSVHSDPPLVHGLLAPVVSGARALLAVPCTDPSDKLRLRIELIAERIAALSDDGGRTLASGGAQPGRRPPAAELQGRGYRTTSVRGTMPTGSATTSLPSVPSSRMSAARSSTPARTESDARSAVSPLRPHTRDGRRVSSSSTTSWCLLVHSFAIPIMAPPSGPGFTSGISVCCLTSSRTPTRFRSILQCGSRPQNPTPLRPESLPWNDVAITPGHLFVVGDPKQSIYRFRRADIATFMTAAAVFGGREGRVELTANFRTGEPIIEWINATFAAAMTEPPYIAFECTRGAADSGPPVSVLGRLEHPKGTRADDVRAAEATEVATAVARIVHEGWRVADGHGGWRAATLGDVTILVPARTSLPFLEDALDGSGIAFRVDASSLVYSSRAVRDVLMVLRAVDDPTNYLHVVSALRTPLFGCGDDDLYRFHNVHRGRWSYLATQPDTVPDGDPVRQSLEHLRVLHDERKWLAPSELLGRIALERRAFELGFSEGRPRDVWRRLRFVIDQARAWSDATGGNLREYLAWVGQQASEGARVAEAILPETDDDAVRIMTIHAAKGLEFPVTIVSGMSTAPRGRFASAQVVFPPSWHGGVPLQRGSDRPGNTSRGSPSMSRWGSTSASGCSMSPAPGRVTTLSCRCIARLPARIPSRARARTRSFSSRAWACALDQLPDAAETAGTVPRIVVEAPAAAACRSNRGWPNAPPLSIGPPCPGPSRPPR